MQDSCNLYNLSTGPVVKLHANTLTSNWFQMIIQYSLDNVSGLSRLRIQFISQKNDSDNEH